MKILAPLVFAFAAFASTAFAADPPKPATAAPAPKSAASAVFAPARLPGRGIDEVLKAFPSAREVQERCHHEAVVKARIECTRLAAHSGGLGYQLEFTRGGILIRSVEYAVVPDAATAEKLYRQRVAALTKAFGKGRVSSATPSEGLKEARTAWTDKPARHQRAGVVLITKGKEPAVVMDYLESHDPSHF
jgi:hypothetical protein